MSLRQQIEDEIRRRGPMPFSTYMQICLYDPVGGYYSRQAEQFGKAGDFYTSSDVHAVFGRLLARQFDEIWLALDRPPALEIVELGPGRGLFASDVLDWSKKKFPDFFAALTYTLQESSAALRSKLQERFREHLHTGKAQLPQQACGSTGPEICRSLPPSAPLILYANEFFDALPVEILSTAGKLHLGFADGGLREIWLSPLAEELEFLDRYGIHPENCERIEVPLLAQKWMAEVARAIGRGIAITIDYGYTRSEQLAGRHRGTLMAYRRHSASANPYQSPGEHDLTAHVNFTALAAMCQQALMPCQKLITQSQFLMGIGERNQFADAVEECRMPQERAKVALQLKHLLTPEGMGENFRVLIASRGLTVETIASLSGMSFAGSSHFADRP